MTKQERTWAIMEEIADNFARTERGEERDTRFEDLEKDNGVWPGR